MLLPFEHSYSYHGEGSNRTQSEKSQWENRSDEITSGGISLCCLLVLLHHGAGLCPNKATRRYLGMGDRARPEHVVSIDVPKKIQIMMRGMSSNLPACQMLLHVPMQPSIYLSVYRYLPISLSLSLPLSFFLLFLLVPFKSKVHNLSIYLNTSNLHISNIYIYICTCTYIDSPTDIDYCIWIVFYSSTPTDPSIHPSIHSSIYTTIETSLLPFTNSIHSSTHHSIHRPLEVST